MSAMQLVVDGVARDMTPDEVAALPVRPLSLDARRSELRDAVDARRDAILAAGYSPTTGPLAGHTLQNRPDTDDRSNWLVSQGVYRDMIAAGHGDVRGAEFRTAANVTVVLTFAEGAACLLGMAAWGAAVLRRSWALKDAIAAAATASDPAAALDAIDPGAGWPD